MNRFWYPLYNAAVTASLYTTIALSLERNRARIVKFHCQSRVSENRRKVLFAVIGITVFSIALNSPKFFELQMVDVKVADSNTTEQRLAVTNLYYDYNFVLIYDTILGNPVLVAVPIVSLSFLNLRIFFGLKRRLATFTCKERGIMLRNTTILFAVVLIVAVCHSIRIYWDLRLLVSLRESDVQERWARFMSNISLKCNE